MAAALTLARRGLGRTWPNPAVGALVVRFDDGPDVVARGWTAAGGRPHAEAIALRRAGGMARGATLYVTLEPCAHHGRTPPCADAIAEAGVARVVCAMRDPDPRTNGAGLSRLKQAGVDVTEGVGERDAHWLALGHVLRVTRNRPFVQLKLAVGADGLVPAGHGAPVWVTGDEARARAHLLRAQADAILVGRGTIEADNPLLTCRLPGMADRSPVRAVLDSGLRLSPDARLLRDSGQTPTWLVCAGDVPAARAEPLAAQGAEIVGVSAAADGRVDLKTALEALAARGITRLLVEGGPRVARGFLDRDLVDEIVIFEGTVAAGAGGLPPFGDQGLESIERSARFRRHDRRAWGADHVTAFRRSD